MSNAGLILKRRWLRNYFLLIIGVIAATILFLYAGERLCFAIRPVWHDTDSGYWLLSYISDHKSGVIVAAIIASVMISTFITLNYTAKAVKNRLKFFEWGGRPLVCYFANFATDYNWMGKEDFLSTTDEDLKDSVSKIKQMSEDYEELKPERFEFINNHEKISDGVYCTTYSNGTKVIVDYNNENYKIERK